MSLSAKVFSVFKRDIFLFGTELLTSIVVARTLGPEMMGIYAILQMIPTYAEILGRIKMDQGALYVLGKKKARLDETVFQLNLLTLVTSGTMVAMILWKFDWIYSFLFKDYLEARVLMAWVLPLVPLNFLQMNYAYLHLYQEDIPTYNRMLIVRALTGSALSLFALLVLKVGLMGIVLANLTAMALSLIYGAAKLRQNVRAKPNLNFGLMYELIAYGTSLYVSGIASSLNQYISNLMVARLLIPSQMAFFSMARGRAELLNRLPGALSQVLLARLSKTVCLVDSARIAAKAFRVTLVLLAGAALLISVLIKPMIAILYGSRYLPLVPVFWLLLPGIVVAGASVALTDYFIGIGKAGITAKITLVPLVTQVALSWYLIPRYQTIGAAASLLGALAGFAIIQVVVFQKVARLENLRLLVPAGEDVSLIREFIWSRVRTVWGKFQVRRERPA